MGKFKTWDFDQRKHIYSDEVLQLSATDMKNAGECEFKVYYKLLGARKPPKLIYLVMGSIFHSVVEQDLRFKAGRGINKKWDDLLAFFESEWKKETKGIDNFGKFTEDQAKAICLNYIKIYSVKMSPMLYPLNNEAIEKFFRVYITFGGVRLGITGKMDLIGKDMWVTDHKTSSSPWSQEQADKEIQAQIYPFCAKSLGYPVQGFKFNTVTKDKVEVFPVAYDPKKVKEILTNAFSIKQRIEDDCMLKSRSSKVCNWCDYKDICKEKLAK